MLTRQAVWAIIKSGLKKLGLYDFLFTTVFENRLLFKVIICRIRYKRLLKVAKRKPKDRKIRVLFIVSEIAKWKEQSLYEGMESSGQFYPVVGLSAWNRQNGLSNAELDAVHSRAEAFFDKLGNRHVRTVTVDGCRKVFHSLSEFNPDIVFYTEPWSPCERQNPDDVSKFALTYYVPYFVPNYGIISWDCHQRFHQLLHGYFCLSQEWCDLYRSSLRFTAHATKFIPAGHPALDYCYRNRDRKPQMDYVIYAPHYSFPHKNRKHVQTYGTFEWNGLKILEYAESHPEIKWVFKPHPVLWITVIEEGFMTEQELRSYYARWRKVGIVCEDSDYQEYFLESRCMITDSGSFLSEYGATERPIIHLICAQNQFVPIKVSKDVYDTYYQVHNLDELYDALKLVVEERQDPNKKVRCAAVRNAGLSDRDASANIINYLLGVFNRK